MGRRGPVDVVVHPPEYVTRAGEDWADGVYPAEPSRRTWTILVGHDGKDIDERQVIDWLDTIYADRWGDRWRADVEHHRRAFATGFLAFEHPFTSRDSLAARFDELFDGTEAILASDMDAYREALGEAGRVVADEYLIPLPNSAKGAGRWNDDLRVRVVDADYSTELGLGEVNRDGRAIYRAGEVV